MDMGGTGPRGEGLGSQPQWILTHPWLVGGRGGGSASGWQRTLSWEPVASTPWLSIVLSPATVARTLCPLADHLIHPPQLGIWVAGHGPRPMVRPQKHIHYGQFGVLQTLFPSTTQQWTLHPQNRPSTSLPISSLCPFLPRNNRPSPSILLQQQTPSPATIHSSPTPVGRNNNPSNKGPMKLCTVYFSNCLVGTVLICIDYSIGYF